MPHKKPQGTSSIRWFFRDPWRKLSSLLIAAAIWVVTYNQITSGVEVTLRVRAQQGKPVTPMAGSLYLQNQIDSPTRQGQAAPLGRLIEINEHPVDTVNSIELRIEGANESLATLGSLPSAWFQPGDLRSYRREEGGASGRIVVDVDPDDPNQFGFYPAGRRLEVKFLSLTLSDGQKVPIDELELVYREMEPLSEAPDLRQIVSLGPNLRNTHEITQLRSEPEILRLLVPKGYSPSEGWAAKMFAPWEYSGLALETDAPLDLTEEARRLPIVILGARDVERDSIRVSLKLARKKEERQPVQKVHDAGTKELVYDFTYLPPQVALKLLEQIEPPESLTVGVTIQYFEDPTWSEAQKQTNRKRIQDLPALMDLRLDLSPWLVYDEAGQVVYDPETKLPKLKTPFFNAKPSFQVTRTGIYEEWPKAWTEKIGETTYQPEIVFTPQEFEFRQRAR